MNKIIHINLRLNIPASEAFDYFVNNDLLKKWLTVEAEVDPGPGGKYELFWAPDDRENDSTIGCIILVFQPPKLLVFEWKGARQFQHFMNENPLTTVSVFFTENEGGTEIGLLHTGWGTGEEWEEARLWFLSAWTGALKQLESITGA